MKYLVTLLIAGIGVCEAGTFAQWIDFSDEEKLEIVDYSTGDYRTVSFEANQLSEQNSVIKNYIGSLEELPFEPEIYDDYYGIIGDLEHSYEVLLSSDGEVVAATQYIWQQGCSHEIDGSFIEESGYYDTEEEANGNNCFDNDVSWSAKVVWDEQGKSLYDTGYMEWSGH
jgi:hypothetical protein